MPLNVKCKNCNNYRNSWCERVIDSPDPDMVKDCPHFWEKANADRIRAMSDEELATVLNAFSAYFEECNRSLEDTDCHDCELCELCGLGEGKALKWLQQPAEVDNG